MTHVANNSVSATANGLSPADWPLVALIVLVPVLAGPLASSAAPAVALPAMYLAFEIALLAWATRHTPPSVAPRLMLAFAWRMQVQAAMQVLTRGALLLLPLYAIDTLTIPAASTGQTGALYIAVTLPFLAKLAGFYVMSIAWWRMLVQQRRASDLATVLDGSICAREISLPGLCGDAEAALDRHLASLTAEHSPRLARLFYQARTHVIVEMADGKRRYVLSWALLPVRVVLAVRPTGAGACLLELRCQLRGGIHRLEYFPSPALVQALLAFLDTNLVQTLHSTLALVTALQRQDQLRHQALESQLRVMQAQIEPHFLFNTLANVRQLYRSDLAAGEAMMDHFIAYLRGTLDELRADSSTVGKEMDLVLHYLAVMNLRMGGRLSSTFIQPDDLATLAFPPAMLIALVENAIMHGVQDRADGKLTISAMRQDSHLRVSVQDNGAGFSSVQGSGVGLSNIRRRLEASHGNAAWLEVGALPDGGFIASIVLPLPNAT